MSDFLPKKTKTLCPKCLAEGKDRFTEGTIFEEGGKIWLETECKKHGKTRDIYWSDSGLYMRCMMYRVDGKTPETLQVKNSDCPGSCGLCPAHISQTALANMDITNRCNLSCRYCFAHSGRSGRVFEPSIDEIEKMLDLLSSQRPVPCYAVQFSGGEPTVRKDLPDIIRLARKKGFAQIQIASNGINLAKDPGLAFTLRSAGLSIVYLKFNGTTKKTNIENLAYIDKILGNCRKADLGIVLVPTIIKGFNNGEVPKIIRFAADSSDIIRGVNFQPIAFVGNIESLEDKDRKEQRYTIPDLMEDISKTGCIDKNDFYPIPSVFPISKFVEKIKKTPQLELTPHPACGAGTYIFVEDGKIIPVTRFVDVPGFFRFVEEKSRLIGKPLWKIRLYIAARFLDRFVNRRKAPKGFNPRRNIFRILTRGTYDALSDFHRRSLFIGVMHFQDAWNMDYERLRRCVIHYVTPDLKIIPFCAYNCLPKYRSGIEKKHSITVAEWKRRNKGKAVGDVV